MPRRPAPPVSPVAPLDVGVGVVPHPLPRRLANVVAGVLVALLWTYAVSRLATTPQWVDIGRVLSEEVRPRPGVWRLLRGGLHHLALPALALATILIGWARWRRDRRSALLFVAGVVATTLVVQGMKRGLVVSPPGLNPLSGHVGVAAGIGLSWFTTTTTTTTATAARPVTATASRAVGGLGVGVLSGGMAVAVLLTGWHDVPEVLGPLGVATGCAVGVATSWGPARPPRSPLPRRVMGVLALGAPSVGSCSGRPRHGPRRPRLPQRPVCCPWASWPRPPCAPSRSSTSAPGRSPDRTAATW